MSDERQERNFLETYQNCEFTQNRIKKNFSQMNILAQKIVYSLLEYESNQSEIGRFLLINLFNEETPVFLMDNGYYEDTKDIRYEFRVYIKEYFSKILNSNEIKINVQIEKNIELQNKQENLLEKSPKKNLINPDEQEKESKNISHKNENKSQSPNKTDNLKLIIPEERPKTLQNVDLNIQNCSNKISLLPKIYSKQIESPILFKNTASSPFNFMNNNYRKESRNLNEIEELELEFFDMIKNNKIKKDQIDKWIQLRNQFNFYLNEIKNFHFHLKKSVLMDNFIKQNEIPYITDSQNYNPVLSKRQYTTAFKKIETKDPFIRFK